MANETPASQCPNDRQRRLSDLIADAIVTAYLRRQPDPIASLEDQAKSAIPIVYNFIDYLLIALPEQSELLIGHQELELAISTETGLPVSVSRQEVEADGVPFGAAPGIRIIIRSLGNKTESSRQFVSDLLQLVTEAAKARSNELADSIPVHLANSLVYLAEHFNKVDTAPSLVSLSTKYPSAVDVDQGTLDKILLNTAKKLETALTAPDMGLTLAMRYYVKATPEIVTFEYVREGGRDGGYFLHQSALKSDWYKQVQAVFRSGFARWCCLAPGRILVSIPYHLGGVPWLVACRELPCGERPQWWAYTIYRDHSIIDVALRAAGRAAVASEMRRLFVETSRQSGRSAEETSQYIQQSWRALMRIFPIRQPLLHEIDRSVQNQDNALPLLGKHYAVSFDGELNPFFTGPLLPDSDYTDQWGPIGQQELHRSFTEPLRSDLMSEQARLNTELAEHVYAIGHPLKSRLGRVMGAYQTVRNFSKTLCPQDHRVRLDEYTREFDTKLEAVTNTAKCFDMMAELSRRHGNTWEMDRRKNFLVEDIHPVWPLIKKVISDVQPRLDIRFENVSLLERAFVQPTIPTLPKCTRLFDPFYDDLVYELLTNAEGKVPDDDRSLCIGLRDLAGEIPDIEDTSYWCLEFANPIDWDTGISSDESFKTGLSLEPGKWTQWNCGPKGPKGGLRLIAVVLHATDTGTVWAQPQQTGASWLFRLAIRLPIRIAQKPFTAGPSL